MNSITRVVSILALAAIVFPMTPALAEQPRGFYIGVGVGNAESDLSAGDLNDLFRGAFASVGATFTPQTSSIDAKDSSLYIFAGYRIFPWLSAEGGYVDLGSIEYTSNGTLFVPGSGTRQITNRMELDTQGVAASALGN